MRSEGAKGNHVAGLDAVDGEDGLATATAVVRRGGEGAGDVEDGGGDAAGVAGVARLRRTRGWTELALGGGGDGARKG